MHTDTELRLTTRGASCVAQSCRLDTNSRTALLHRKTSALTPYRYSKRPDPNAWCLLRSVVASSAPIRTTVLVSTARELLRIIRGAWYCSLQPAAVLEDRRLWVDRGQQQWTRYGAQGKPYSFGGGFEIIRSPPRRSCPGLMAVVLVPACSLYPALRRRVQYRASTSCLVTRVLELVTGAAIRA